MSNNYNIVVPEGDAYPKQEFVDSYLNSIDDIPTCADIEKLKDMGITAAHEYIREKLENVTDKTNEMFGAEKKSLEKQTDPIKDLLDLLAPLANPPQDSEDVIGYLVKVAKFFEKLHNMINTPYTDMLGVSQFYLQFGAAAAQALANKANDIGCLVNFEFPDVTIPQPTIPNQPTI